MSQDVTITCGTGNGVYEVVLAGETLEVFRAASQKDQVKGKHGEDLVTAILADTKGKVSSVTRFKDGEKNDGPSGEPAFQHFNDTGATDFVLHYQEGKLVKVIGAKEIATRQDSLNQAQTIKPIELLPSLRVL